MRSFFMQASNSSIAMPTLVPKIPHKEIRTGIVKISNVHVVQRRISVAVAELISLALSIASAAH